MCSFCGVQALSSLGEAAYEVAEVRDDEEEPRTYALSPNFAAILDKLVKTADRLVGWYPGNHITECICVHYLSADKMPVKGT